MVDQESKEDSINDSVSVTRHKIIFVGDVAVGKTSIIARIIDNPFSDKYIQSIGVDFCSKNIRYRGKNVKLQIWDTAGQEKYKSLIPSYIRNASIVFLVYDISNRESFDNVANWIQFIRKIENSLIVLVGNKLDLSNKEVNIEEGEDYAKKEGLQFYEISAKTNQGIKTMFYSVVAELPIFQDENDKQVLIKDLENENANETKENGFEVGDSSNTNSKEVKVLNSKNDGSVKNKTCKC